MSTAPSAQAYERGCCQGPPPVGALPPGVPPLPRDDHPVPGPHHDTRAWLRLAGDPARFAAADTPFERVHALWRQGLLSED